MMKSFLLLALLVSLVSFVTHAFTVTPALPNRAVTCCRSAVSSSAATADRLDPQEIVARTIRLKGDVQGGYFRACVLNEVGWSFVHANVVPEECAIAAITHHHSPCLARQASFENYWEQ